MYKRRAAAVVFGLILFAHAATASAWTGPSASPPNGNVPAPINVGTSDQNKAGKLSVGQTSLPVFTFEANGSSLINGALLLYGTGRYLNFGTGSSGSGGYGIRDNAGAMEYKNSGGSWVPFAASGVWATSGTNIYNTNTGNVGIGTATPNASYKLTVYKVGWKALFQGTDGYIALGPANASWAHIYTDRPNFIFNHNLYVFSGDGTGAGPSGISSYNTQDLALMTNGTARVTIKNGNGNVGIGTSAPLGELDVENAAGNAKICLNGTCISSVSGATSLWTGSLTGNINNANTGNVGIGTASPTQKLDVSGDIAMKGIDVARYVSGSEAYLYPFGVNAGAARANDTRVSIGGGVASTHLNVNGDLFVKGIDVARWDGTNMYLFPWGVGDPSSPVQNTTVKLGGGATAHLDVSGSVKAAGTIYSTNQGPAEYGQVHLYTWGLANQGPGYGDIYLEPQANRFVRMMSVGGGVAHMVVNGNAYANAFIYNSDARLKKDVAPLSGNLEKVLRMHPVSYLWKDTSRYPAGTQIGFIAQEMETVVPEIVHTDDEGMKSIDYVRLAPLLVGSVQELSERIEAQEKEIEALKAQLRALIGK